MSDKNLSREELRKKLKEKIKNKRNGSDNMTEFARNVKNDPQTAMLSMGIEDLSILNDAKKMVNNPLQSLKSLQEQMNITDTKSNNKKGSKKVQKTEKEQEESDDEEMPPEPMHK